MNPFKRSKPDPTNAKFGEKVIECPICYGLQFEKKKFLVAGSVLQTLDLEGFGKEGIMLSCVQCGYVLSFAKPDKLTFEK